MHPKVRSTIGLVTTIGLIGFGLSFVAGDFILPDYFAQSPVESVLFLFLWWAFPYWLYLSIPFMLMLAAVFYFYAKTKKRIIWLTGIFFALSLATAFTGYYNAVYGPNGKMAKLEFNLAEMRAAQTIGNDRCLMQEGYAGAGNEATYCAIIAAIRNDEREFCKHDIRLNVPWDGKYADLSFPECESITDLKINGDLKNGAVQCTQTMCKTLMGIWFNDPEYCKAIKTEGYSTKEETWVTEEAKTVCERYTEAK